MKKVKKLKLTRKQLKQKLIESNGQQAHTYHFASKCLVKTSTNHLMASGVLLQLTFLGGAPAIEPVVIRDGLSAETIQALKADLKRSYALATTFKVEL